MINESFFNTVKCARVTSARRSEWSRCVEIWWSPHPSHTHIYTHTHTHILVSLNTSHTSELNTLLRSCCAWRSSPRPVCPRRSSAAPIPSHLSCLKVKRTSVIMSDLVFSISPYISSHRMHWFSFQTKRKRPKASAMKWIRCGMRWDCFKHFSVCCGWKTLQNFCSDFHCGFAKESLRQSAEFIMYCFLCKCVCLSLVVYSIEYKWVYVCGLCAQLMFLQHSCRHRGF